MYLREQSLAELTKNGNLSDRAENLPQPDFEYLLSNSGSLRTYHIFPERWGHSLECEIHFITNNKIPHETCESVSAVDMYASATFVVNDDNHEYFAYQVLRCSLEGEPLCVLSKHDLEDRSKVHQSLMVPDWIPLIKDIVKFYKQIAPEQFELKS